MPATVLSAGAEPQVCAREIRAFVAEGSAQAP